MSAKFIHDIHRGPGYGIVIVDGDAPRQVRGFALYRASDGRCLAQSGWQGTECYLVPDTWDIDAGTLRLSVGTGIVDHLDALDMYRILLRGPDSADGVYTHTLVVESIVYSQQHGGGGVASAVAPKPMSPPPSEPEPEQVQNPQPAPGPDHLIMGVPAKKNSALPLVLALIVLTALLALAVGSYFWYTKKQAENIPQSEAAPVPVSTQPRLPMIVVREHLRSGATAQASLDLARELQKNAADTATADAVFLLLEDAAQKGQPEAMYLLGVCYDTAPPALNGVKGMSRGSVAPDMAQAYEWYNKALAAGYAQAKGAMTDLKRTVEAASHKGDSAATELLHRWAQ